jgi:hypothetical protein
VFASGATVQVPYTLHTKPVAHSLLREQMPFVQPAAHSKIITA